VVRSRLASRMDAVGSTKQFLMYLESWCWSSSREKSAQFMNVVVEVDEEVEAVVGMR
jgi:hypothetical protein